VDQGTPNLDRRLVADDAVATHEARPSLSLSSAAFGEPIIRAGMFERSTVRAHIAPWVGALDNRNDERLSNHATRSPPPESS
jgi:hypothetical protein